MIFFNLHHIEDTPRIQGRKSLTISTSGLRNLIRTLRQVGMEIVSLKEILDSPNQDLMFDDRLCILTFDDGYDSIYHHAAPILIEEACPATVFTLAAKFSGINDWDPLDFPEQSPDRLLSLRQIQELAETDLFSFGSHGMTHVNLATAQIETIKTEILGSYDILSRALQSSFIPVFSYPWGRYHETTLQVLSGSKYQYALTSNRGHLKIGTPKYEIPRYLVDNRYNVPLFLILKLFQYQVSDISSLTQVFLLKGRKNK